MRKPDLIRVSTTRLLPCIKRLSESTQIFVVLLLVGFAPFVASESVIGQGYTTITSVSTSRLETTLTRTNLKMQSQTTAWTSKYQLTTSVGAASIGACSIGLDVVKVETPQTIHIDYSSTKPTDFYIMNTNDFTVWLAGIISPPCFPYQARFSRTSITSGSFDVYLAGQPEAYWLIFIECCNPLIHPYVTIGIRKVDPRTTTVIQTMLKQSPVAITSFYTQEVQTITNQTVMLVVGVGLLAVTLILAMYRQKRKPRKRGNHR